MLLLQESIVYVWLVPVFFQIVLPLSMLILWLGLKILENLFGKKHNVAESVDTFGVTSFEKAA